MKYGQINNFSVVLDEKIILFTNLEREIFKNIRRPMFIT